ncbi:MAG: tripartite tricarboxylate transporter TctB family protein [Nocardioidaceae bacterium]
MRERAALLGCCALGLGLFAASLQYPVTVDGRVGPGMYPLAVALVIVLGSLPSLVLPQRAEAEVVSDEEPGDHEIGDAAWRVPVLIGVLVAYVAVVESLGHLVTSCVLAWIALRIVGERPWWQQIPIALGLGIGTAELFARIGVPLPLGALLS